jgi:hypothetical protein
MKLEKLKELEKYLNNLCDNYCFDEIDAENFDTTLARTIKDINYICEVTKKDLIKSFGNH